MEIMEIYHILPINDIKKHKEVGFDCSCKPKKQIIYGKMLIIHNAFDCRERKEELIAQVNEN
jgi:hypothetical protein